MRVLYLNHTGQMSGGEHSLIDLLSGLPASVSPVLACPGGDLEDAARKLGVHVVPLRGTKGSLRLHPRHTARAVNDFAADAIRVRRLVREHRIDLIHANSVRAGIVAALAGVRSAAPLLVHVRDCLPATPAANAVRVLLTKRADMIVRELQVHDRAFRCRPVGQERYGPQSCRPWIASSRDNTLARRCERAWESLESRFVAAVIAQLTPWNQCGAIIAWVRIRESFPDALLLLVGEAKFTSASTRFDNRSYRDALHELVEDRGLGANVRFLGQRSDVPAIVSALDVLLAPSWEEPFGRTIIEAMAMGVPAVATNSGGPAEIIDDGVDGVLLPRGARICGPRRSSSSRRVPAGATSSATAHASK